MISGVISDVKTGLRVLRLPFPSQIPNETAAKSPKNMHRLRTRAVCCFRGLVEIKLQLINRRDLALLSFIKPSTIMFGLIN